MPEAPPVPDAPSVPDPPSVSDPPSVPDASPGSEAIAEYARGALVKPGDNLKLLKFSLGDLIESLAGTSPRGLHRPPGEITEEVSAALSAAGVVQPSGVVEPGDVVEPSGVVEPASVVEPAGVFGVFPVRKEGERIAVEAAGSRFEFDFPRKRGRSIADWLGSGRPFIPYLVTMGSQAVEIYRTLEEAGRVALAHEWASLCAALTEAAAEKTRAAASQAVGAAPGFSPLGLSPGYPMWKDLAAQEKLLLLLDADLLGVSITPHYQLVPEFSTTGIVIIDANARY